jgi:hypothetical protein
MARSPSLEKADHVCKKWNALMASMAAWWRAVPSATPPHLKNVTCNAVDPHTLTYYIYIMYKWELTY